MGPPHFGHKGKCVLIAINSRFHIWDTHWLLPGWYLLISCIICPLKLFVFLVVLLWVFSFNLWSYCNVHDYVHKTNNIPLYLFYTDCIYPNSVTFKPSLYEIFAFSFFPPIVFSWTFIPHLSIFLFMWSVILLTPAWSHFIMTLSTGNYYDVNFLPKWRTQIWGKIDLGGHNIGWEAIPKDTDLRSKMSRIWGYSNFIWYGFVGGHIFE